MNKYNSVRSLGRLFGLAALLVSMLAACASGLKVRSEIDPSVDFSQYTTFNFFEPMGIEGGYNSPIFGQHFREALGSELGQRRYRTADVPDLLINVTVRADDKVKMRSRTAPYMTGGYYGRPGGAYAGSAVGVGVSLGSRPTQVTETSVFIDFVDLEQHRVVWQGVAVFNANEKVAQHLRDTIYTAVNKVMEQYPHTAGR